VLTQEIMSTHIHTIAVENTLMDAAKKMREAEVGCLVATDDGEIAGIITDRDLVVRCLSEGHDFKCCLVSQHMSVPVISVPPSKDMLETAHMMMERDIRRIPVIESGKTVGLVSLSDIAQAMDTAVQQMDNAVHDLLMGMGASRA
jgi:signal-transduction protein with cAMP-binding, CBS, and nucleotidyltransferase domain